MPSWIQISVPIITSSWPQLLGHMEIKRNKISFETLFKYSTLSYFKCFLTYCFPPTARSPFKDSAEHKEISVQKVTEGRIRFLWINNKGMDLIYSQSAMTGRRGFNYSPD